MTIEECLRSLVWENYTPVEPVTLDEVVDMERLVGLPFPADYREVLLRHQGMAPDEAGRSFVKVHEFRAPKLLGAILPIKAKIPARNLNNVMERKWKTGYPRHLLHVADSLGARHFALDYFGGSEVAPSVVYVDSEAPRNDQELEEWRSGSDPLVRVYSEFDDPDPNASAPNIVVFHVASSITDLLAGLIGS